MATQSDRDDRSIVRLLTDLSTETTALLRGEIDLAKAEISEKVSQAAMAVAALAAGALVLFAGFLVLLDAAVFGLGRVLEPYGLPALAALIVAIGTMIVGLIILLIGRSALKAENLAPRRTAESLRRDREFVKEQVR
jgi:Putative Actinobacterial Holin-X, holin superfamily III